MSRRPSSVADPYAAGHDILEVQEFRVDGRFVLKHIKPGPGDLAACQHARQRFLVDDFTAAGIDDMGINSFTSLRRRSESRWKVAACAGN